MFLIIVLYFGYKLSLLRASFLINLYYIIYHSSLFRSPLSFIPYSPFLSPLCFLSFSSLSPTLLLVSSFSLSLVFPSLFLCHRSVPFPLLLLSGLSHRKVLSQCGLNDKPHPPPHTYMSVCLYYVIRSLPVIQKIVIFFKRAGEWGYLSVIAETCLKLFICYTSLYFITLVQLNAQWRREREGIRGGGGIYSPCNYPLVFNTSLSISIHVVGKQSYSILIIVSSKMFRDL